MIICIFMLNIKIPFCQFVLAKSSVCLFRWLKKTYIYMVNICRNPKLRPTFSEIMAALKPLQNSPQVPRPSAPIGGGRERVQPPRVADETTN